MTNEEAIKELKYSYNENITDNEAIDMAIKALEQEPCGDAMNRILKRMWNCRGKHTTSIDKVKMELILRDELQPVNSQPKTGHWIKYGVPRCGEQHYKCSSCGYYINFGQCGELYTKEFKYCPNCRRRMIEPEESEEQDAYSN